VVGNAGTIRFVAGIEKEAQEGRAAGRSMSRR
jgi:hypothetical protein